MQPLFVPHLIEPVIVPAREWRVGPRRVATAVGSGDELHEDVLAIGQGCLIMSQQLPRVFGLLLRHKRIVSQFGQFLARKLAQHGYGTRVLRILAPLRPSLAERYAA